ncbi:MAG: rhodanese-like domain-containing protein [Crocinitomicaceae bacterium]|nr:rhodanese-like domain-containing protein [Crocinitomicaceae bacterium]
MRLLFLFILILSFNSNAQTDAYKKMLNEYYDSFPTITAESALKKVNDQNAVFLDIREMEEFNISHIQGALNVGYEQFYMDEIKHLKKSTEIIVYCSIGARSQEIGKRLKKFGYTNVHNLYGGLFHWSNLEYPLFDLWENPTKNIHGYSKDWGKWVTKGNVVY